MTSALRSNQVRKLALESGFIRVGIAPAGMLARAAYVDAWLAAGRHGEMEYLRRWHPARLDPRSLLAGARSVIVVADNYKQTEGATGQSGGQTTDTPEPGSAHPLGRVSQYAWGRDYHRVLRKKLKLLVHRLAQALDEPFEARICVDTAPLLERELAAMAGVGWIGKNTMILHQDAGSFFFLGEIVTTLDLEASSPVLDRCGTCTRCLDACPTHALTAPYQMDATRCISYLTIEHRTDIPSELQPLMGDWLYGCDVCQDVCPYNTKGMPSEAVDYAVRHDHPLLPRPRIDEVLALSEAEHAQVFQGSAIRRATPAMLKRNAEIVRRNAAHPDISAT